MPSLTDEQIKKAAHELYEELSAITTIYHMEFVRKDNDEKIPFASFYGKTFSMKENMSHKEIIERSKRKDKDILEEINKLEVCIEKYIDDADDFISKLHTDIVFTQFHGEDHKRRSIADNVDYCETAEQAFEKFKHYLAIAKNPELAETAGDEHFDEFLQSSLFDYIKNL